MAVPDVQSTMRPDDMSNRPAAAPGVRFIAGGTDVLTDMLTTAGLNARVFCCMTLRAPWTLVIAPGERAHFHVVEQGNAYLQLQTRKPLALGAGDLIVLMRGQGHALADAARASVAAIPLPPAEAGRCSLLEAGGGGAVTQTLCGSFAFRNTAGRSLTSLLPEVVHLQSGDYADIAATLRALWDEATGQRIGSQTAIARLTDLLFVQTVREILGRGDLAPSWLTALRDARIGLALAKMHEKPVAPWTVDSLARAVGMSRSPFAARFAKLVGVPPLTYLANVRMQRAMALLREGRQSLSVIAGEAGYESYAAFSKAFARITGTSPREYARQERGEVT
jgi:AraC-like DNA-binding protein